MRLFFEIAAVLLGLIQGMLVMLNKRSNWVFYSLQMACLTVFSLLSHLYGDMANNLFYFLLGIVGFMLWKKGRGSPIRACSCRERILYIAVILIGTFGVCLILRMTSDPLPLLDAFTTVSSLVATYYMLMRRLDAWGIWFINDLAYILEYYLLPDMALYLLLLNVIWTGMAVGSFISWKSIMKKEGQTV